MINNSFCVASWFNVRNDNDGTLRACTDLKDETDYNISTHTIEEWRNSDFMQNLREELANNKRPESCQECWRLEDMGIKSHRQHYNELLKDEWMELYFDHHPNTFETHLTISSDIKTGNKCNLECSMCRPEFSSKIHKTWLNNPNLEFTQFDTTTKEYQNLNLSTHLDKLFEQPLQFVNIFGGEPLMEKRIINKLLTLPTEQKNRITLNFITNGTFDIVKYSEQLSDFKSLRFAVSIDSVNEMNNYIRRHSDWNTVTQNLLKLKDANIASVHVPIALQILNIFSIQKLLDWLDDHNIESRLLAVDDPDYLSLDAVPTEVLNQAKQNITDERVLTFINNAKFKPVLYEKFKRYIKWYEKGSSELEQLQPELYSQKSPT